MAQELKIDGQIYEASTAIAGAFGYTADYVSKLAREGKVLAQQVGRQWYVERSSLTNFSNQASKQKLVRKEALRKERKMERVLRREQEQLIKPSLQHPTHALAKTLMIFALAAVGTALGLVAVDEGVDYGSLQVGIASIAVDVTSLGHHMEIEGDSQVGLLAWLKHYWSGAAETEIEAVQLPPVAADPSVGTTNTGLVLLDPASDEAVVDAVRTMFSDPVTVELTGDDSGLLTPVFKERNDESYRFLLVPVNRQND